MSQVLDVLKVLEINQLFKEKGIAYTLHSSGGCASCGLELRGEKEAIPAEELCAIINEYLKDKWIQVESIEKGSYFLKVI